MLAIARCVRAGQTGKGGVVLTLWSSEPCSVQPLATEPSRDNQQKENVHLRPIYVILIKSWLGGLFCIFVWGCMCVHLHMQYMCAMACTSRSEDSLKALVLSLPCRS